MAQVLRVREGESFWVFWSGQHPELYSTGRLVAADHPVAKKYPERFETAEVAAARAASAIEVAVAPPGEKRTRSRPVKKG